MLIEARGARAAVSRQLASDQTADAGFGVALCARPRGLDPDPAQPQHLTKVTRTR